MLWSRKRAAYFNLSSRFMNVYTGSLTKMEFHFSGASAILAYFNVVEDRESPRNP